MKGKKLLLVSILILVAILISATVIDFNQLFNTNKSTANSVGVIANKEDNNESVDINTLKTTYNNDEIVGVLKLLDDQIIVTQSDDNEKYLTKDIYGKKDKIGNPFLDYRVDINNSKKLLIYGHNGKGIDTPFKKLEKYYDKDFYLNHPFIELVTDKNKWKYEIFSVYVETRDWSYMKVDFKDQDLWLKHLENIKSKSLYETDIGLTKDDNVLVLQTCSFKKEYQNFNKKYLLVFARRVN